MHYVGSTYVAHELLGSGATGEVWRGTDSDGAPVAVKILRPEFSRKRDVVRRFIQERDLLTDIDHPHVVRVHDLVYDRSLLAIVMDLIDGGDLAALIFRAGPLPPQRVRAISAGIAMGLAAIHAADIVHLDLKPGNVLLSGTGEEETALIADLGVSQLARGPAGVAEHPRFGTPQYTAPEVVTGGSVGSDADVYALGLLMVEMLQGRAAIDGGSDVFGILDAQISREVERPDGADDHLWQLISSMIAKDPEHRPTALDAAVALGAPRAHLASSALLGTSSAATQPEKGVDRPLFPAPTDAVRSDGARSSRDKSVPDGPATTPLGHRTSILRAAQTVALDSPGPRTMALPPTAPPIGHGTVADAHTATPAEALSHDGLVRASPTAHRRGRRGLLVAAGASAGATALVAAALAWLPLGAEDPSATAPSPSASTPTWAETATPSEPVPADAIVVPDVTGMTEQAARQQIHGGLRVEAVSVEGTASDDGLVAGTSPETGSPLSPGDTVTLQVARELASQPLTDLSSTASTGEVSTSSVAISGASSPGSLVLEGEGGLVETTTVLQKRYLTLEAGIGVPDGGDPVRVQISLDQVPVFDETVQPGDPVPLSLDVTDAQQLSFRVASTGGGSAEAALITPTLSGEKGRVPGS